MASARGERLNASGFRCQAANTSTREATTTNQKTKLFDSFPAGRARICVRGFSASISASTNRLNAIAADRAATRATTIQNKTWGLGMPRAASTAPVRPNGSVSTECSHLIISRVVPVLCRMLRRTATFRFYRLVRPGWPATATSPGDAVPPSLPAATRARHAGRPGSTVCVSTACFGSASGDASRSLPAPESPLACDDESTAVAGRAVVHRARHKRETVLQQQLQYARRIATVRLLLAHIAGTDLCRIPHPNLMSQILQ